MAQACSPPAESAVTWGDALTCDVLGDAPARAARGAATGRDVPWAICDADASVAGDASPAASEIASTDITLHRRLALPTIVALADMVPDLITADL